MLRKLARKWWFWVGLSGFLLFVLVFGGVIVEWNGTRSRGEARRDEAVRRLDAADPGWRAADLCAARNAALPPKDQNAADSGALAAAQDLGNVSAMTATAKQYVEETLETTFTSAEWNSCGSDGGSLANIVSGSNCISYSGERVRVRVPDQQYDTFFAKVAGVDSFRHSAFAVAGLSLEGFGGVLPFGVTGTAAQLANLDVPARIELLKSNIRRLTRDLLHYEVIEIRLLQPDTGKLVLLVQEGMIPEATGRELLARAEGNGVTGFVAATGKSYLCPDTQADPLYLPGAPGAHSSLTVPLRFADQNIGTFNVESPQLDGFTEEDVQFAEIFCRELASALHTLELLLAEKRTATTQSIEAVSREVALPVDEILAAATSIIDRWIGHEPEMADKLKKVVASARQIKQSIQKVGEDILPPTQRLPFQGVEAPAKLRGMRVLVVDNDERVRRSREVVARHRRSS